MTEPVTTHPDLICTRVIFQPTDRFVIEVLDPHDQGIDGPMPRYRCYIQGDRNRVWMERVRDTDRWDYHPVEEHAIPVYVLDQVRRTLQDLLKCQPALERAWRGLD